VNTFFGSREKCPQEWSAEDGGEESSTALITEQPLGRRRRDPPVVMSAPSVMLIRVVSPVIDKPASPANSS
jgi:hypothetical protein